MVPGPGTDRTLKNIIELSGICNERMRKKAKKAKNSSDKMYKICNERIRNRRILADNEIEEERLLDVYRQKNGNLWNEYIYSNMR